MIKVTSEDKSFEFDARFNEESSEKEVYRGTAGDTIQTFIYKGFNGTILSYGQTGSRELFVRCSVYFTVGNTTSHLEHPTYV